MESAYKEKTIEFIGGLCDFGKNGNATYKLS
jgi:hypothetical protein